VKTQGFEMLLRMRLSKYIFGNWSDFQDACVGFSANWANINTKGLKNILWNEHTDTFRHFYVFYTCLQIGAIVRIIYLNSPKFHHLCYYLSRRKL
jgi:hypothetical protein